MIIFSHPPRKFGERGYFEAGRSDALMLQKPVIRISLSKKFVCGRDFKACEV